ncbi:hypothetical protein N7456_006112 [Penicillium angulare]|uniref:Concanavalin A-like lectin/glucanase n=1 Tax=Penicillium angulare TaxID=116970 RepID=A0A9W9FZT3_9EURO|nr:hypothetical protein N7456_006112 [Penicillium angulare]
MWSIYAGIPIFLGLGAVAVPVSSDTPKDSWEFGNSLFYLGPPSGSAEIIKATYSILAPAVPSGYVSSDDDPVWVSIWVGASASESDNNVDLYQPLFNWSPDQEAQGCPASTEEWCVAASTYTPDSQIGQSYIIVPANTTLDFEIAVEDENVIQTVTMAGKVISKQSDALDYPLQYLLSSDECYTGSGSCGSIDEWYIRNLTVTLSEADSSFSSVFELDGVTAADLTTSDSGTTWHTEWIKITSIDFENSSDLDE